MVSLLLALVTFGLPTSDVTLEVIAIAQSHDFDESQELPLSETHFMVNDTFYIELWVSTLAPNGLAHVSADIEFEAISIDVTSISHSSLFDIFTNGVVDDKRIDDLSGSHYPVVPPCSDYVGLHSWAKMATIGIIVNEPDNLTITSKDAESLIYTVALCGGFEPPVVEFGILSVAIVEKIPPFAEIFSDQPIEELQ